MNLRNMATVTYPLLVAIVLIALGLREARAGHVRQLQIGPDQPAVVHLAFGRTTAISFSVRPEKVVPGSPQAIEVNFLGKDVTVRPLSSKAGNLLVYTKNYRFVILFQVGSEAQYDDVVKVAPFVSKRPLRLSEDSYVIKSFQISKKTDGNQSPPEEIPVLMRADGRSIEGEELRNVLGTHPSLICPHCIIKRGDGSIRIKCADQIAEIQCHEHGTSFLLRRSSP